MVIRALKDIWSAFSEFTDQALLFALVAVLIYTVVLVVTYLVKTITHKPHKSVWYLLVKLIVFTVFGVYCSYAISLTLSGREAGSRSSIVNLVPFSTFTSINGIAVHTVENCLLFVPFGFLVPIIWKYNRHFIRVTLMGFISSVLIELTQIITNRGYFEVDDIILNTLGAMIGYFIFSIFYDGFLADRKRFLNDYFNKGETGIPSIFNKGYDRLAQRNRLWLFVLQVAPIVCTLFTIMDFSSDTGDESASLSRMLALKVASIIKSLSTSVGSKTELSRVTLADMLEGILRKMAHMFEYAVLAFFIWAMIYSIIKFKNVWVNVLTIGLIAAVGSFDEYNQSLTPGRNGTPKDVFIDCGGALLMLLVMWLIIAISRRHVAKRLEKLNSNEN